MDGGGRNEAKCLDMASNGVYRTLTFTTSVIKAN